MRPILSLCIAATFPIFLQSSADATEGYKMCKKGSPDSPTPKVRIVSPLDGNTIKGTDLPISIETKDFEFAYDSATTPGTASTPPKDYARVCQQKNSGHVHVYLAPYDAEANSMSQFLMPKFFMVKGFKMPNKGEFSLSDVKPGKYRLLVELVQHDHSPRIKHHPRDWPPLDMISVSIE